MIEFEAWPKTPRLNRDCVITEKIDGTNAAVIVTPVGGLSCPPVGTPVDYDLDSSGPYWSPVAAAGQPLPGVVVDGFVVAAQSRKRIIKPGKQSDNAGFAGWVRDNAQALADALGEGRHFGEWWGQGIQHGYGLDHKRFALFNVARYADADFSKLPNVGLVPELYRGPFTTDVVSAQVQRLRDCGSFLPGAAFQNAEGVIVFHAAGGHVYKVLCENDEIPKGAATSRTVLQ